MAGSAFPSVKILKTMPFKGGSRLYSNRYHFSGGTPADATHWHTLTDAIVLAEKAIHFAAVEIVEALCYAAGSDVPVASKVYTTFGTLAPTGAYAPGEAVALVRYSTNSRTTKNHPIYLFNYFHYVAVGTGTTQNDSLANTQLTAMGTYAAAWISGFSDGTITAKRCGPNGELAVGSLVEAHVTHRDFPYTTSV